MPFRVTDATVNSRLLDRISEQRQRIAGAQEKLSSGKRINRPSDDPFGAAAVIDIRNSQTAIAQFGRSASTVNDKLTAGDSALNSYEQALNRAQTLVSQGLSGFTRTDGREALATELDGLRQTVLNIANTRNGGEYVFGGTSQNAAPVDATETLAATPGSAQLVQIEPDTPPIASGVTADTVFANIDGTVFQALKDSAAALRGTGDPAADQATLKTAMGKLSAFLEQSSSARTILGKNMNAVEAATNRNDSTSLALESTAQNKEGADFAKSAVDLAAANNALQAILDSESQQAKLPTLLDMLG
jgi:flagellar hook-associated protein 3 FlgL